MTHEALIVAGFASGIVIVFSPCATALLPAYLSYYLAGREDDELPVQTTWPRLVTVGLLGVIGGVTLLIAGAAAAAVRPGGPIASDLTLVLAGGMVLSLGTFVAWEGGRGLEASSRRLLRIRIGRSLLVGAAASLGIGTVYLGIGLAARAGLQGFPSALPWVAFASAAALVVVGILLLLGVDFGSFVPRIRAPRGRRIPAFYLFGAAYGLVASGCFLPVFLPFIVAASALPMGEAVQVLVAYALGSALVFLLLSILAGAAHGTFARVLRTGRRYVRRVAGAVVVATGAYVLWFDWTFFLRFELGM